MHPVDHVIWRALNTRQAHLGVHAGAASRFEPDVSSLAGFIGPTAEGLASLAGLLTIGETVGLVISGAAEHPAFAIVSAVPVVRMVRDRDDAPVAGDMPIALTEADVPDMLGLVELTRPGPFGARTRELGDYVGIRRGGALVAMAGERLRVPGFTEISAVCTHPDHVGRGHAAALTSWLVAGIVARGERAFLHVRPENTRAIALYERLGFVTWARSQYVIVRRLG